MNRGAGIPKARKRGSVFGSGSRHPAESLAWSPRQPDLRTAEAELLRRSWVSGGRRFQTHRRALRRWWRAGVFLGGERRPDTCRPSLAAFPTVGRSRAAGEILSCSPQWTIGGRSGLRRPGRRTFRLPPRPRRGQLRVIPLEVGSGGGGAGHRVILWVSLLLPGDASESRTR